MRSRERSGFGNISIIGVDLTVEGKDSKKKIINRVVDNLGCCQKQNRNNSKTLTILRQKISHETWSSVISWSDSSNDSDYQDNESNE